MSTKVATGGTTLYINSTTNRDIKTTSEAIYYAFCYYSYTSTCFSPAILNDKIVHYVCYSFFFWWVAGFKRF